MYLFWKHELTYCAYLMCQNQLKCYISNTFISRCKSEVEWTLIYYACNAEDLFLLLHQLHFIIIIRQSASTILFTNIQILKVKYYRKREYNLVNFLTFVTVKSIFCLSSKCSISGYWSGNHKGINVVCKKLSQEVR